MPAGCGREQITMARTLAALPAGSRITDYISLGVVAKFFPVEKIHEVLEQTRRASVRERDLPAHVVVYYVIALALYMRSSYREVLRCLLEGVQWLLDPSVAVKVAGKSGISQARSRLGSEPLRKLYEAIVEPIATKRTKGAWYRQWRLISLDGSTLDTADTVENEKAFGRPGASRGSSAFPKIRFVALLENGTHVLWAARMSKYRTAETTLAQQVLPALRPGMLCLADRFFPGYKLWRMAARTRADLLWRIRQNARLDIDRRLPDGSYLSRIYLSTSDRRNQRKGIVVRVIDYRLKDVKDAEAIYRLITTILDPTLAPAQELAALYHERWEVGVSSQGHIVQSVQDRPRPKDSGLVAGEASWRASKTTEPSDNILGKECAQRTRLQRTVNADVASLHESPVAETVYNVRKQQGLAETSPTRRLSPAGYQRRHGVKEDVETGETLGAWRRKLVEEMTAITVSGKCSHRHQGGGSGRSTVDGRAAKRARREGPGPVSTPLTKVRQG
jgi:Insertion element 4 transposase N-terminal/Transposase DDE domain